MLFSCFVCPLGAFPNPFEAYIRRDLMQEKNDKTLKCNHIRKGEIVRE